MLCTQPELASALQRRDVASLRKAHFFALCGLWHYKSDVWVDRAQAKRRSAVTPQGKSVMFA